MKMEDKRFCRKVFVDPLENIKNPVSFTTENVSEYSSLPSEHSENNDANFDPQENDGVCPNCSLKMKLLVGKSILVCENCGLSLNYTDTTSENMAFGDNREFTNYSYERISHFTQWLINLQGKETVIVPREVIQRVCKSLRDDGVVNIDEITVVMVNKTLKKLKLKDTYDHVVQIWSRICGKDNTYSPELEERLKQMFRCVQAPFDRHCPPERKNFLSYGYCFYKFCQLLGQDHLLTHFNLLKGADKLQKQDDIFKKICEDLNWQFISSPNCK